MQPPILPPGTLPLIQTPERHEPEIQLFESTIQAPEVQPGYQPSTIPHTYTYSLVAMHDSNEWLHAESANSQYMYHE